MQTLNKRKHHTRFGTANKRELYFQDGCLFDEQGKLLPHDLERVQRLGYQVTNEIRDMFVQQALAEEKEQQIRELEAQLEIRKQELEREWKRKVEAMNEELIASDVPAFEAAPPEEPLPALVLSPLEVEAASTLKEVAAARPEPEPEQPKVRGRVRPSRAKADKK